MLNYKDLNPSSSNVVIFIHGLGASLEMWEYQFDAFTAAGYRVIAPDMPGFGDSPESQDQLTIENMADSVSKLMDTLNLSKAHIIGLSMGGAIAQKFALKYPEKLEKLVLTNTAARFANKLVGIQYLAMRYLLLKIVSRETSAKSVAKLVFPQKDHGEFRAEFISQIMKATDKAYLDGTKACIKHDLRSEMGKITAETMVILGKKDKITPPRILKQLANLIPHSQILELNGGHVTPVDCSEQFNREVLAFLNKND